MPFDCMPLRKGQPGRTLFLSDLHLGALGSRSDVLLGYLKSRPAETYYLVGDVLDLWLPLLPHWTEQDQAVIDYLRQRQAAGATIHYIRGNHDPAPERAPCHARLDVDPVEMVVHQAVNGRRYLVIHGDQADGRLVRSHLMTRLGSLIDHVSRRIDKYLRLLGGRIEGDARSLVEALLNSVNAVSYAGRSHERRLLAMARDRGLDGVICGHFHIARLHDDHGLTYANCGDWVDSLTGLEEGPDGTIRLFGGRQVLAESTAPVHAGGGPVDA